MASASLFSRKLTALQYPHVKDFDVKNEQRVQQLVSWLENCKIRLYKIEDREAIRKHDENWKKSFNTYLSDLKCPRPFSETMTERELAFVLDWLINYAIFLDYRDNVEQYTSQSEAALAKASTKIEDTTNCIYHTEELLTITDDSPEFVKAVTELAAVLGVPTHEDHLLVLKACVDLIQRKFIPEKIEEALSNKNTPSVQMQQLEKFPLGFDTGDALLNKAATVLRMLYIEDQRQLQTKINEILVLIQNYTANPKTDTTLGKVGK